MFEECSAYFQSQDTLHSETACSICPYLAWQYGFFQYWWCVRVCVCFQMHESAKKKKKISSKQMSLPTVCACISLALRVPHSLFLPEPSFYTGNCGYCVCMLQHVFCALMLMTLKQLRSMSKQPNTSPKPLWLLIKRRGANLSKTHINKPDRATQIWLVNYRK